MKLYLKIMEIKHKSQALIGFSVNAEIIQTYDRMSIKEKGVLESLEVDLCGTSANVARAITKLGGLSKVLALTGVGDDFESMSLRWALKNYKMPYREFQILSSSHISVFPIDGLNRNKVFGKKGKINESKVDEVITGIESETGLWRIATGVRPEEIPFVRALFNSHVGYRSINPRLNLIEKREDFFSILKVSDLLILNEAEFSGCNVAHISELHGFGPSVVIMTKEKYGGVFSLKGRSPEVFQACTKYSENCKQLYTIGAGDWFHSAFLVRCMEAGKPFGELSVKEIRDFINFAARVAGKKITMPGSGNGPSIDEI